MRNLLFIICTSLCGVVNLSAQSKIYNVDAYPAGKAIAISYDLKEDADISIYVSKDLSSYRKIDVQFLRGDIGKNIKAGEKKKILWHVLEENPNEDFRGNVSFKIKAFPAFKPFVLAQGAYAFQPNQWSVGLMAGAVGVAGFYVRGATNFSSVKHCDFECGADGLVTYQDEKILPLYNGKQSSVDWMATAGAMVRLYIPLYIYLGGGYGQRELYWGISDDKWVNNLAGQYKGFCGDVGLMGNIHHFAISLGVSTIQFKYAEINVGLGYMF